MFKKVIYIVVLILVTAMLALVFRGNRGNPIAYQAGYDTRVGGPFESSNSSARYALTESIAEEGTFELNLTRAKFASPDVVEKDGKFFSIFTPGVSFIAVPFYLAGKMFSLPQLGAYLSILLFAIVNFYLVTLLSKKLGAGYWSSLVAGLTFTFATNALAYSQTLTQHHMSVTVLVAGILIASRKAGWLNNLLFGILAGVALLLDVPALILMIPVGIWILAKNFSLTKVKEVKKMSIRLSVLFLLLGFIPLVMLFGYYNKQTTGSYTTLAQSVGRSDAFKIQADNDKEIAETDQGETLGRGGIELPFDTREQIKGFYTLLISNERAWIYYSPVILLGIAGLFLVYKKGKNSSLAAVVLIVIILNIVLYSMFGDPWGGWAFGPRYLIPSAALLSAATPIVFYLFKRRYIMYSAFLALFAFSVYTSALGAMTTNAIPPKVEAVNLPDPIPYTSEYNSQIIGKNQASSLVYNLYLSPYLNAQSYLILYSSGVFVLGLIIATLAIVKKGENHEI